MTRKGLRRLSAAVLLALLSALLLQPAQVWNALADQLVTPTDLITPVPSASVTSAPTPEPTAAPTEAPRTGKRSGYALIQSGAKVWTSRKRTSSVGTVTANSYVWIPNTSVASLTYKIRFDTELSTALDECHTYYVLSEDVRWLSDAECAELEKKLEKQDVRDVGGTLIPVISFDYRKPPATPKPTATPKATPSPTAAPTPTAEPSDTPAPATEAPTKSPTRKPTATPAPTAAPTATPAPETATDTDLSTPTPRPTATPGIATDTDLSTPTPKPTATPSIATDTDLSTPTPTPTATPGIATDTDLSTPAPTPTATPGIATDTDLSAPTPTPGIATDTDLVAPSPAPELLTTEEMRSVLDQTNPQRQVTIWVTCTDPYFNNGSRMTLWANISGYEGLAYTVVWEVDRGDGLGYVNAGADGLPSLSFIIDDDNVSWRWRAGVSIPYMEKE